MGFLDIFRGKSPEEIEQKGDALVLKGAFGPAKIEYEKALAKLEKKAAQRPDVESRIKEKIAGSKEALAQIHVDTAKDLIEAGCFSEADERLSLAKELSENADLIDEVEILQGVVKAKVIENSNMDDDPLSYEEPDTDINEEPSQFLDEEEYFNALVSALPEEEQAAYETYGEAFVAGYVALNQGDFSVAEVSLKRAFEENTDTKTFIPLELATCYLNMGAYGKAKQVLQPFMQDFPHSLRAYQVMCETLWGERNYEAAGELLSQCPKEMADNPMIRMLKGETLIHAGKLKEAERFYQEIIKFSGRDLSMSRSLAGVYEMLGETEKAKRLYSELLDGCKGCGRRPDTHLKLRFAETSFDLGERTTGMLEIYLDLANEDPFRRSAYYGRISDIYSALGHEKEAVRFKRFSEKELKRE